MNKLKLVSLVTLAAATLTTMATQRTMNFSGTITEVDPIIRDNFPIYVGEPFNGSMSFDPYWDGVHYPENVDPDLDFFYYPYLHLNLGPASNPDFQFNAVPRHGPGGDVFFFNSDTFDSIEFGGEDEQFFRVSLGDSTGKAIIDGPYPLIHSLNRANWDSGSMSISFRDFQFAGVAGTLSPIPDSTNSATLLTLGIAGLFFCRPRSKTTIVQ